MMEKQQNDYVEIGAQLIELRKRLQVLEDERKKSKGSDVFGTSRRFYRRSILAVFVLLGILGAGGLLYGEGAIDALFIDKEGNVGIGTSAPKAKLDVAGTVKANEFTATNGASLTAIQNDVSVLNLQVPIGTLMAYGGDTTKTGIIDLLKQQGWLPCNGASVSINQFQELYNVIGNSFGGNLIDQFNLPDMRGRFLRGVDQGAGRDPDTAGRRAEPSGGNSGDKVGSVQEDEIKKHSHRYSSPLGWTNKKSDQMMMGTWATFNQSFDTTQCCGEETRPKNIYVNWIIKAKNILSRTP